MTSRFSIENLGGGEEPQPVDYDTEGFDGPEPGNVQQFPRPPLLRAPIVDTGPAPSAPADARRSKQYTGIIKAALDVLSARLLGLIAVIGAVAMFGYAVYDPIPWRTYTVVAYACVVLFPTIYLYLKKG